MRPAQGPRRRAHAMSARRSDLRLGGLCMLGAGASFALMGAFIKLGSATLPTDMVVFLRNAFSLLILVPILARSGGIGQLRTQHPLLLLLRTCLGLAGMTCFYYAIPRLNLSEAVLLNYSQPLFIPFIAWAWLQERPSRAVYPAIVIGFAGVALILKPGAGVVSLAGVVGLCAGLFAAFAMVTIRRLSASEPTTRIVMYYSLLATLLSGAWTLGDWHMPGAAAAGWMLGASAVGTSGQLLLTRAYSLASAARVGPLIYSAVVFAGVLGWLIWGETPDLLSLGGTALVISAGVIAIAQRRARRVSGATG